MGDVSKTPLPGVGVRHDFTSRSGERLGVISHRSGDKDLLVYDHDDPDSCAMVLRLGDDDVRTLADILGGSQVTEDLTRLQSLAGLTIDWIPVTGGAHCTGRRLADLGVYDDLGASIVAVVRGEETIASPGPEFRLLDGDTAVAVGTPAAVRRLFEVLRGPVDAAPKGA
jgi:K+:H+ antiporter subunit KhtT